MFIVRECEKIRWCEWYAHIIILGHSHYRKSRLAALFVVSQEIGIAFLQYSVINIVKYDSQAGKRDIILVSFAGVSPFGGAD